MGGAERLARSEAPARPRRRRKACCLAAAFPPTGRGRPPWPRPVAARAPPLAPPGVADAGRSTSAVGARSDSGSLILRSLPLVRPIGTPGPEPRPLPSLPRWNPPPPFRRWARLPWEAHVAPRTACVAAWPCRPAATSPRPPLRPRVGSPLLRSFRLGPAADDPASSTRQYAEGHGQGGDDHQHQLGDPVAAVRRDVEDAFDPVQKRPPPERGLGRVSTASVTPPSPQRHRARSRWSHGRIRPRPPMSEVG